MPTELRDERNLPIFIHRNIDDYGMSPNTFRVYAHLARRAGQGEAWPSYQSIGDHCFSMVWENPSTRRRRAIEAINELVATGLVVKEERKADDGRNLTNIIRLVEPHGAVAPYSAKSIPMVLKAPKGTPMEGTPKEENTVPAAHTPDGVQGALFVEEETALPPQQPVAEKESPPIKPKDHPAVQAYRSLVERYPNRAQMKMIAESNPDIENWELAMRTWIGRGYNPGNVDDMLKWAENPALMERRATAKGKFDPTEGASWAELFEESERRMARQEQPYA